MIELGEDRAMSRAVGILERECVKVWEMISMVTEEKQREERSNGRAERNQEKGA